MTWRGHEEIKSAAVFERRCKEHQKPLSEGKGDRLLCPIGHVVVEDEFLVVRVTPAPAQPQHRALQPEPTKPAPKDSEPMTMGSKGTGASGVLDSQGFHSLGGHRMFVYLKSSKTSGYVVSVKHVDDNGKARNGVIATATTEEGGRKAFAERLELAENKGWIVGRPRRANALTDIPDAPPAKGSARK